jgi:hypothetical protein
MENKLNNIISLLQSMEKQIIKIENRILNIEKKINVLYFEKNPDPLNPDFPPFNPHNPHNPIFPKHPNFYQKF